MSIIEIILLGAGLAMDAFAVSITKGLQMRKHILKNGSIIALFFGGFQAFMPLIGFYLGRQFIGIIADYDHWIAFILLALIGIKAIVEAVKCDDEDGCACQEFAMNYLELTGLAVATSIDALAVGISLAMIKGIRIGLSVSLIGVTTFIISLAGIYIGHFFGEKFKRKAEIAGGIILVLLGLKILLEGIGVL